MTVGVKLGQPEVVVAAEAARGSRLQPVQPLDQVRHGRCRVQSGERHRAVAHLPGELKTRPHGALLARADHPVLGFADDRRGDRVGVPAVDEMPHAEHLVLLVAEHAADDGARKRDPGALQGRHGHEHGREVALGVVGPPPEHPPAHDFGAEGVMRPGGHIPGSHHIRVALEHEGAWPGAGRMGHDHVGPPGCHRFQADLKAVFLGPARRVLCRRLLARSGGRVPDRVDFHQCGREIDDVVGIYGT